MVTSSSTPRAPMTMLSKNTEESLTTPCVVSKSIAEASSPVPLMFNHDITKYPILAIMSIPKNVDTKAINDLVLSP